MARNAPYELELRAGFLRLALLAATAVLAVYLLQGLAGLFRPRLFPWDALLGLALVALCFGLYRQSSRSHIGLAAGWLVAGLNVLAAFYSQLYGVRHPVTALYLVGLVLAGMLIGGWFLRLWGALGAIFVLLWAVFELLGEADSVVDPIQAWPELWQIVALWWTLIAVTTWLVQHFAQRLERAVLLSRAQTETLTRTLDALAGQPELETFLRQIVLALAQQLGARQAALFLLHEGGDLQRRFTYVDGRLLEEGQDQATVGPSAAGQAGIWRELAAQRAPLLMAEDEDALFVVPLLQGDHLAGYFALQGLAERAIQRTEIELAQALAQQATLAMYMARLAAQQEQSAVLAERNRLAREIHDTLAQGFTGILIQLEAAEDLLETGGEPQQAAARLARARSLARESLQEARRSVQALRPAALQEQDLAAALYDLAQRQTAGTALQARVAVTGKRRPAPEPVAAALLRIAQEAVTNALKHSGATHIDLALHYGPDALTLTVVDDGRGFDLEGGSAGFGLQGMRERAALIGAHLQIQAQPGAGVRLLCRAPLPPGQRPA